MAKIDDNFVTVDIAMLEHCQNCEELFTEIACWKLSSNLSIKQNGLGYNNILSMAILLGDLQKKPLEEPQRSYLSTLCRNVKLKKSSKYVAQMPYHKKFIEDIILPKTFLKREVI